MSITYFKLIYFVFVYNLYVYLFFISRYMSQKLYEDAIEMVHNGACLFLKHKQVTYLIMITASSRTNPAMARLLAS